MPIIFCRRTVLRAAFAAAIGSALLGTAGAPVEAATAAPAPAKSLVVLVVDTQKVVQDSKAGQAVRAQMQERMARYQKGISKQDEEFKAAQAELSRQRSILAQDVFATKVKDFEGRVGEARQKAQEELKSLSDGERSAYNKIELAMLQVVADIAKERHANLVLAKSTILLFDTSFEITDEALKRLNEKLPTVTVEFAKSAGGGTATRATGSKTTKKR